MLTLYGRTQGRTFDRFYKSSCSLSIQINWLNDWIYCLNSYVVAADNLRHSTMSALGPYIGKTASQIITEFKKGSIRTEFPAEYLEVTYEKIEADAKRGNKNAKTAKKLLTDSRFDKQSKTWRGCIANYVIETSWFTVCKKQSKVGTVIVSTFVYNDCTRRLTAELFEKMTHADCLSGVFFCVYLTTYCGIVTLFRWF